MKGSKIDTSGLPHHRILGQILYELICRESSGDGVRIAALRRELAADDVVARAYPHNLSKAISNSLRRLLWDGKIIREARGFYQIAPTTTAQSPANSSSANQLPSTSAAGVVGVPGSRTLHPNASASHFKHRDVSRQPENEEDEIGYSDDEATPRKRTRYSSGSSFPGLQLPPLLPPPSSDYYYQRHQQHQQPHPTHPHHLPEPSHILPPLQSYSSSYPSSSYTLPRPNSEAYYAHRPGFGTSWERNPPLPRLFNEPLQQPYRPAPSAPAPPSLRPRSYAPPEPLDYDQPGRGQEFASRNRVYQPTSLSSSRHLHQSPSRSPPPYSVPSTTSYSPRRPALTAGAVASSSSRGDSVSHGSSSRDTSSTTVATDASKPLSIASLLSRPTSPSDGMRQNFAKRCPHLARLVVEALEVLSDPHRPGVSSSAVQDWVSDNLGPEHSAVLEAEQQLKLDRATEIMLASLCFTGAIVELGFDESRQPQYVLASSSTS